MGMKLHKKIIISLFFSLYLSGLFAEVFKFRFTEGQSYKVNSFVKENVYVNMRFSHSSEITNRITVSISDVQNSPVHSALNTCTFMTSEKSIRGRTYSWAKKYPSVFRRNELGAYDISDEYFMPVVRDVPIFDGRDIPPGGTWKGTGYEAHDFRDTFGLEKPFTFPFEVTYTYVGEMEKDGKKLHHIKAHYQMRYELPDELIGARETKAALFPVTTLGTSTQNLYWDAAIGNLSSYDETFSIRLILNSGDVYDFTGTASAVVTDMQNRNADATSKDVRKKIDDLKLDNVAVKKTDEGITISIENIHFLPDSAVLMESEKAKLAKIAEVLKAYPEYDLLVTGHTALADTKAARDKLSVERANAVAEYLITAGVREDYRIFTKGYGSDRPVAPNDTEANKAKNRRVEITLIAE